MSKHKILFFVCALVGIVVFSFVKSLDLFWDKTALDNEIKDFLKPKIYSLENENLKVYKDLKRVKNTLAETQEILLDMEEENAVIKEALKSERADLRKARNLIEQKEAEAKRLADRNSEVVSENRLLKDKFNAMYVEFLEMKKTLSSMEALRETMRDLRSSTKKNGKTFSLADSSRVERRALRKKAESRQEKDKDTEVVGNSGYLIRDGQSTYVPKVRIKVVPVE